MLEKNDRETSTHPGWVYQFSDQRDIKKIMADQALLDEVVAVVSDNKNFVDKASYDDSIDHKVLIARPPYSDRQRDALIKMLIAFIICTAPGFFLKWEMGTGKTWLVVTFFQCIRLICRNVKPLMIVCPASATTTWCDELCNGTDISEANIKCISDTTKLPKGYATLKELFDDPQVIAIVMSYQTFRNICFPPTKGKTSPYADMVTDVNLWVFDEIQVAANGPTEKNQGSLTAKAALTVKGKKIGLTGTPGHNEVHRCTLSNILFNDPRSMPREFIDELTEKEAHVVNPLPPLIMHDVIRQDLSPLEQAWYRRNMDMVRKQLRIIANQNMPPADRHRAKKSLQIAVMYLRSGMLVPLAKLWEAKTFPVPMPTRIYGIVDLLCKILTGKGYYGNNLQDDEKFERGPVVIFSQFLNVLDLVVYYMQQHPELSQYGYVTLQGKMNIEERKLALRNFNSKKRWDDRSKKVVFLATEGTCKNAINLTAANNIIIASVHPVPNVFDQCVKRAHRRGQTVPVHVHTFQFNHTIEQLLIEKVYPERRAHAENFTSNAELPDVCYLTEMCNIGQANLTDIKLSADDETLIAEEKKLRQTKPFKTTKKHDDGIEDAITDDMKKFVKDTVDADEGGVDDTDEDEPIVKKQKAGEDGHASQVQTPLQVSMGKRGRESR